MSKEKFNFSKFFGFPKAAVNALFKPSNKAGNEASNQKGSCDKSSCGCESQGKDLTNGRSFGESPVDKTMSRRQALGFLGGAAALGTAMVKSSTPLAGVKKGEMDLAKWEEYFKKNYRVMTPEEQLESIDRLEKISKNKHGKDIKIKNTEAQEGVLFGYAFNISKCKGYGECIEACQKENNQDRNTDMAYIRLFEMKNGSFDPGTGTAEYVDPVPAEGNFYIGTQCMQCANPPCTEVCPVKATWQEDDGIVVIDYDWCIGCRYCEAACPYWARRFNWNEPEVPSAQLNTDQHYLGNRERKKGVMEKCTFCISRSRDGKNPACVEACPTGARTFGNLLDPDSELRYILENKKVFRLKEDLGTDPKFWYYMD